MSLLERGQRSVVFQDVSKKVEELLGVSCLPGRSTNVVEINKKWMTVNEISAPKTFTSTRQLFRQRSVTPFQNKPFRSQGGKEREFLVLQ